METVIKQERKGIAIVGNIVTDIVKNIDCYPEKGMMAYVGKTQKSVGGCVPNTAITLKKIDRDISVYAGGKIGDDENGNFVLSKLKENGVDCSNINVSKGITTSFCDVMSEIMGERTFFHCKGANALYSPNEIDIDSLTCKIFHIGYILLLDEFDKIDDEYGTVLAGFLKKIQENGIKTSIDVVSDNTADYKKKIIPALKYCDYAIMNEVESSRLTDLPAYYKDGVINIENIRKTMNFMVSAGVKEKVIIHCKQAGFCLDVKTGKFTVVPSLDIPVEQIKGSVGAGDAFCAGSLYSIYNNYDDEQILEFASAVAASNLFAENSIDGILEKNEIEKLFKKYGRKKI